MKFNNNKYQIKIYKECINNRFHLPLKRIIEKEETCQKQFYLKTLCNLQLKQD